MFPSLQFGLKRVVCTRLIFLLCSLQFFCISAHGQQPNFFTGPDGNIISISPASDPALHSASLLAPEVAKFYTHNGRSVYYNHGDMAAFTSMSPKIVFTAPAGTEIKDIKYKTRVPATGPDDAVIRECLIILNTGQVYIVKNFLNGSGDIDTNRPSVTSNIPTINAPSNAFFKNILGDDLYCFAGNSIYVLHDIVNGPWLVDTAGIGTAPSLYNMDMDTLQNVWLCANERLYMQPLGSGTWTSIAGTSNTYRVFVDRVQRIWISGPGSLKYSTDMGTSFGNAPTGIASGDQAIKVMTDKLGDVYVLTSGSFFISGGNKLYRSAGGTAPFTQIDASLASQFTNYGTQNFYNDILADSGVVVANGAGLHHSADGGNTWTYLAGPTTRSAFSIINTADNQLMISNTAGAFKGNAGNWVKKYPAGTFQNGVLVFRDAVGNIFAKGETLVSKNSNNNSRNLIYRSSDNGNSFAADSAGLNSADVGMGTFYVDEAGVQHATGSLFVPGFGSRVTIWKKPLGQSWVIDTTGLGDIYNQVVLGFTGDGQGNISCCINVSGQSYAYTRPTNGTTWSRNLNLTALIIDEAGKPGESAFALTNGIVRKVGVNYSNLPLPAGIASNNIVSLSVTYDSSGALWAYFEVFIFPQTAGFTSLGKGLYYTTDYTNWKKPAIDVDSARFRTIRAIGDSVFALPLNSDGIYVFKKLTTYIFTGNGNWTDASNWLNNLVPPPTISIGEEILIDPAGSGECILNVPQMVAAGARLTVNAGKKFRVIGNLDIQ